MTSPVFAPVAHALHRGFGSDRLLQLQHMASDSIDFGSATLHELEEAVQVSHWDPFFGRRSLLGGARVAVDRPLLGCAPLCCWCKSSFLPPKIDDSMLTNGRSHPCLCVQRALGSVMRAGSSIKRWPVYVFTAVGAAFGPSHLWFTACHSVRPLLRADG